MLNSYRKLQFLFEDMRQATPETKHSAQRKVTVQKSLSSTPDKNASFRRNSSADIVEFL
jgi:hypothetical protein